MKTEHSTRPNTREALLAQTNNLIAKKEAEVESFLTRYHIDQEYVQKRTNYFIIRIKERMEHDQNGLEVEIENLIEHAKFNADATYGSAVLPDDRVENLIAILRNLENHFDTQFLSTLDILDILTAAEMEAAMTMVESSKQFHVGEDVNDRIVGRRLSGLALMHQYNAAGCFKNKVELEGHLREKAFLERTIPVVAQN